MARSASDAASSALSASTVTYVPRVPSSCAVRSRTVRTRDTGESSRLEISRDTSASDRKQSSLASTWRLLPDWSRHRLDVGEIQVAEHPDVLPNGLDLGRQLGRAALVHVQPGDLCEPSDDLRGHPHRFRHNRV